LFEKEDSMSTARPSSLILPLFVVSMIAGGCSSSPPISVALTPSTAATDVGQTIAISAKVTNDSTAGGVLWSLTGPGTLSSTTASSVTYNAPTANTTSTQQATITATSVKDNTKSAAAQVTVNPLPQIPFQSLPNGFVGSSYNQPIQLTGGSSPFQWSVYDGPIATGWQVGGSVPDGLTLNSATGTISGTPTGAGTWYFEVTLTDAAGVTTVNGFMSIEIESNSASANPVPFLNQTLVPTAVAPGGSGVVLSVSGTGFVSGAAINWNGTPLTTTFLDGEHLSAVVPATSVVNAGTASVTVVNPPTGGGRSNAVYFQVGAAQTGVTFANATNSPLQIIEASALTLADFNEDGKPDLAVTANSHVYVMLGNGDGTFSPASGSPLPVPSPPYDDFGSPYTGPAITVGDFNHSGHAGLAVGLFQNESVAILFGNGNGTFSYSETLANMSGQPTMSVTAGDFNGDGNLDMVAMNSLNGESPIVSLGYGHGVFNAVPQNIQISGISSAAGDFNGDGKLDLVLNGQSVLLGNGDGTFTSAPVVNANGFATVADFNGDGKLDLAVCGTAGNIVTILLGDGTGKFTTASGSPIAVGSQPQAIITGDFNNDGKIDLAIANSGDNTVTLLLGNGDGTFTAASGSPYAVGRGPTSLVAADFNGDGKLDLAVVNSTDGTVSILLQK
jgi:hypothetical protein